MKVTVKNGSVIIDFEGYTIKSENKIVIEELENDHSVHVEIQGGDWVGRKDSIGTNVISWNGKGLRSH